MEDWAGTWPHILHWKGPTYFAYSRSPISIIPTRELLVNYSWTTELICLLTGLTGSCLVSGFILITACGCDHRKYWLCCKSDNRDAIVNGFWKGPKFSPWMSEKSCSCLQGRRVKARTALDGKAGPVGDNHGRCNPALPSKPQRTCLIKFLVIPCQWAGRVVGFSPEFLPFLFFFFFKVSRFLGARWKLYSMGWGQRTEVGEESPWKHFLEFLTIYIEMRENR